MQFGVKCTAIVKEMEMFVGRQEKEMRAGDHPLILLDCKKEDVKRGDIIIRKVEDHER